MTVLVTGATGLIGSQLAGHLANQDQHVRVLCRSAAKGAIFNHPNIEVFVGEVGDDKSIVAALNGCRQVYHLAAFTGVWHRDPDYWDKVNVVGTSHLLQAAGNAGVKTVVVTSTAGVLGPSVGQMLKDEEAFVPEHFFTRYEASKHRMEEMIRTMPAGSMRVVMVNPSRLYGPGPLNKTNSVTRMLVQYTQGKWHFLPGSGKGMGNYAFIDDVVQGHVLAMEHGRHTQRYLLGGENISYIDLFRRLDKTVGVHYPLFSVPLPLMLATSGLLKFGALISGIEPLITPGWVRKYDHHWLLSLGKAISELGYTITPYEEGIAKIMSFYPLKRKHS